MQNVQDWRDRGTEDVNTISMRICQEGHANALALNRECNQIAVAGRSRKYNNSRCGENGSS